MTAPLVSVIVAARDAAATLEETIGSVRAQTLSSWELLVSDDGSTDTTAQIAARSAALDERVTVVRGTGAGPSAARNRALERARGRYVAILDADDVAVPERLARQVAFLERNHEVVAVASRAFLCTEPGTAIGLSAVAHPVTAEELASIRQRAELLVFCNSTVMWRTEHLRSLGGFDERYGQAEDAELVNRAVYERGFPVLVMPEPLVWYRLVPTGLSSSGMARQRMMLRYLEERNRAWRAGEDPIALEDFLSRPVSRRTRLRWRRHDLAASLYRRAGVAIGRGARARAIAPLAAATLLHPRYALAKGWSQRVSARAHLRQREGARA